MPASSHTIHRAGTAKAEASIAIMQPYIFPYIGYFQLIHASEVFVFRDDVNFIKQGWITRNRLMNHSQEYLFSIPCRKASQNKSIADIEVDWTNRESKKLYHYLVSNYRKAPHYSGVMDMVERVLHPGNRTIACLCIQSVLEVCRYLGLGIEYRIATSAGYRYSGSDKAERILDIAREEEKTVYINPIGGTELYCKHRFSEQGFSLHFLKPVDVPYERNGGTYTPWLSMLDVLMYCDRNRIMDELMPAYEMV